MRSKFVRIVDGGTLQIEGKEVLSWTKLSSNANRGANRIDVVDNTSAWSVGNEIVIAPSGFDVKETEKRYLFKLWDEPKVVLYIFVR